MVKIKTIARSEKEFVRETKQDLNKVFRNSNPILHPFQKVLFFSSKYINKFRQESIKEH